MRAAAPRGAANADELIQCFSFTALMVVVGRRAGLYPHLASFAFAVRFNKFITTWCAQDQYSSERRWSDRAHALDCAPIRRRNQEQRRLVKLILLLNI